MHERMREEESIMEIPAKPLKVETLESEELEGMDEVIYVDREDGNSFSLNLTAAAILELCDGHRGKDEIVAMVREQCHEKQAHVAKDIEAILEEFAKYGIIYSD